MGKDFGAELFGAPDKGRDFGADLFGAPAKPEDVGILSGTGAAFKRGLESFGDVGQGYGIAGLKLFGSDEEVAKKMAEAKAEQAKTVEKPAISFADLERIYKEKGLGAALSNVPKYIAESTAESAPQMAVPLAAGAAAGLASGPFAPIVAPVVGIGTYGLQQFGNLMNRQGQEAKTPEDISVGKAAIASAIQAPIGYFVDRYTLGLGGMGEKGVFEVGKELAKRKAAGEIGTLGVASGVAKQAGKGAAQGFIAEAPTEVLEQSLERWQAGLPLADADAYREYKEAFFGAGGVGLTGGAISRGATAYKGYKTPEETIQEEAPLTTTSAPQGQLLLPRPDEILLNEKEYDPLKNPVGNFTWQELTKEQRAYIDKDRKDNGKPLLNTYSLEDVVDAIRHTENTPEAQEGAINTLLAYKTNYDQINNEQLNADLLFKKAELHNVDTGTQGWNDYLTRVTGTDDIANMTQPQLYSAFKALDQLEVNPAERVILPEGTNAVRFNEKQYADALKGLEFDFGEYGTNSLSRTSVIDTIKEYTNLTRNKDAEALFNQAIKRGDLEENLVERNTTEGKKFVPEVSFAGASEALPGGFDIRDQAFKHGAEPEAYEIRNGAAFLKRVNDANTAQQEVEKLTKINEGLVKESQKKIDKLQKTIEYRNGQLDLKRATGFANTLGFKKLEAHIDDLNKTDQKSIAVHENDIKNLTNPLQIVPIGEKPVVKRKHVFYKEGKPTASFEKREEAEAYGILNLDDATLEQIVASAPTTKGTLPKRYAAMAKKELERRRTDQKGIEVKRSFYTDETKAKADELAKTLIPALKRFGLENVGLRIVNSIRNGTADGEWAQQVVTIAMDSKNPMGTLRHESIHALKELGAFTDAEWKVLENKAKGEWVQRFIKDTGLYDKYKEEYSKQNKGNMSGFDAYINEEAIAEAFKYFEKFQPPAGMVGNIFYRISQMMEAIRNAFNGLGLNTPISIFNKIETGGMQIDASLLNYDPLVYKGEIDDKGNRYALLQHASRVDFENISEKDLKAFAFGYGAYTSVTPAIGKTKLSNADVTEASKHYGKPFDFFKNSKGYIYVADIPLNRENTLFLSESPESQPVIAEKMVKVGIIEEDKKRGGYKTTKEYGDEKVYSMDDVINLMGEAYANDMILSGYPLTGLMQEKKPSAKVFNDEYGIKKRIANELSDLGIDVSLINPMNDIYAIVHKPEKFNDSLVGKYEMDSKGKIKTISGVGVESESLLEKVKEALRLFPKKQTEFKIRPEDLPELGDNVRFSLRGNEPRKIGDRIVGAPPNATTEADRKKLINRMVKLLEHPYSMYERSKEWYERSGATIKEIARDDPVLMEKIVRLTALYSQANSLGGNITAVIKSIAQIANGNQKVFAGRFPETTAKVIPEILAAKTMDTSLKGVDDKLMNFYRNLHDATFETDTFQDSSTIDRWMMRLFGYPHTEDQELGGASAVSATQYKYAKDLIERITEAQAKKTGEELHPRQIQSVLWTYIRNMSNYDDAVEKAKAKAIEENKKFNKNAVEFTPDILDFSDYVKRATAHITWETRPSESLPMIQGIHTAPREQQDAFNRAVQAIFTDPSGEDKVFKLLNNQQLYTSQFSIGAYENKIAPNIITKVVLQKDEKGHLVEVAREYSAIIGYVTRQDAVPWYRPDPTASGKLASKGYRVSLDVPVTQELEERLFKHINASLPGVGFTKVDESFDFINYRGDDGKPYMMPDKKYIDALQNALQTFSSDVHFNIDEFRAQSEYFSNNWKEQTNGEGHLSRISPERLPNIQSTLDNWRNEYDKVAKRFGEEYGWDKETKFSFRSFKPVEPTFRPSENGGRGITLGNKQENSITVDGVHYGNVKTDELDASKFGTGLRGAERRRLENTDDERIKKRVYFYIPKPNGEMPTRESGVGSNVYTQTFDNILGQGKEMSRLYSSAMDNMNNFESSIIDAGYDGYAIPEMGMMVILNHNVPVNYEGTIAELSEIGRLEKGRILPKPVLTEALQNEIKELRGLVSNITLAKIERALADYTEVIVNEKITTKQRKIAENALVPYYAKAKAIQPIFDSKLKTIANLVGGIAKPSGIKKVGRAAEKLTLETKNGLLGKPDGADISDLLRSTIVVQNEDQIPLVIEKIKSEFKNIWRIKNRFEKPTENGYRDILINVKLPNQLLAEVQINIPEMILAKHTGHKIFKMSRNLDEGTAKHEQLVDAERSLYNDAYLFAQKAKSESSALEPLLRNASLGKGTEVSRAQTNEPSFSLNTGSASTANNVAPSGTLNGTLNIDNSSTEKNKRFSLALGSVEPSTFLVSDANPNNTGNLAFIPPNSRVPIKPIRLAVGTHSGLDDKGFGANHIIDRIRKDASRRPPAISKELLEDIILNVENVGKSFSRIYQEINPIYGGTTYILYDPKTRDSLIVRPRADYYEVITAYKQDVGSKYGNPVWSGANVQPEQPVGFVTKQQGISVKAGERGIETQAVATVVKKRRVLSPEALQQMADDRAGKFSLRAPDTVPFKRWFGNSKIVNPDGTPKVMFHGTARDITVFKPKQAGAIFLTDAPNFAESFGYTSENYMIGKILESLSLKERNAVNKKAEAIAKKNKTFAGDEIRDVLAERLESRANIMPVYVKAENPFDYENPKHVDALYKGIADVVGEDFAFSKDRLQSGDWSALEDDLSQQVIKDLGFDSFYVKEGGKKNLGVYEPSQIKSATGNQGAYDINNPDIRYSLRGEALPSDIDKGDNLTFLLQDKQIDLKRVIENIRKQGKDIADKWNAYLQEELFHGRSAARVKYYIDRELQPMLRKMDSANITLEQMDDYLLARHAKEANAYIRTINNDPKANSGMSDQQADDFMNNMTVPRRQAFERIAKDIDVMTKQTRQMMVDYGLETQKTIDTWEKTYKNYVPLFREETEGGAISTGRGYNIRGSTTRARIGSSRGVIDILANIALQRERTVARGEKNRVGNALLGLILQNPDKNFWSAIRPDEMSKSDLESELLAMGLSPDVARNLADKPKERVLNTVTGNYEFKTNPLWLQQPNIFITRVNGEDRVMIFNKDNERSSRMAVVFNNLDSNQKAEAIKMMGTAGEYFDKTISGVGTATRYFAAINTQYNPAFSIFNFLRDVGGATLNLQSTPLKGKEMEVIGNSLTALKSIYRDLRLVREGKQANSKWAQIFEEFELEGGKTGFRDIFNTSEERANALAAELNAFKQGGARTKAKAVFDWLSDFNEAVENSIRVSAYKSAIDMGMSKQQAASLAKNLTVNFNRTGAVSKNFTTLYAFFNASVQGTARIAETLMKDGKLSDLGKKIVYGGIGVGVLQSVLLAMAGFDEDEPPEFVKDKNFVIPYGDKKYISIPMPLGFNVFPAFGRRATEFAMSDNKNVGKAVFDMSTMIMDAFNPLGSATFAQTLTPTLLDPIVALSENKDFSGKPISKDDLNSLNPTPGYTRAKENASAVSTGLAYGINFLTGGTDFKKGAISPTPDQIDYLIGQVTGGVGREILKAEKLLGSTVSGEELATNNVPVIGRMLGDVKQKTVETSRFYDNVKTMNEHQHEIEGRIKSGQNLDEYLNEHPEAGLYKYVDKTYNKVNQMKRSRKLLKEQNVPDSDLKSYDEAILLLMTSLNDAIREAKVNR